MGDHCGGRSEKACFDFFLMTLVLRKHLPGSGGRLICLRNKERGGIILSQLRELLVIMHNLDAVQKLKFE